VLALGKIMTVGQRTRLSFGGEWAQLVRFRDGKIANLRDFSSHVEALEAAGLSE
jgi:ketosteroid isomerase-like protein